MVVVPVVLHHQDEVKLDFLELVVAVEGQPLTLLVV